mgnify:FL=1
MLPLFGSNIPQYMFEPFDEATRQAIINDAINVVKSEPRVSLQDIDVADFQYGLRIELILMFLPGNLIDTLYVNYIREETQN